MATGWTGALTSGAFIRASIFGGAVTTATGTGAGLIVTGAFIGSGFY